MTTRREEQILSRNGRLERAIWKGEVEEIREMGCV